MSGYNIGNRGQIPEPCNWVAFMTLRVMTRKEYEALNFTTLVPAVAVGADGKMEQILGNRISGETLDDIVAVVHQNAKNQAACLEFELKEAETRSKTGE